MPQPVKYGAVVALVVFFVGWVTGMGGSFVPNLVFSLIVGAFAALCFVVATRIGGRRS